MTGGHVGNGHTRTLARARNKLLMAPKAGEQIIYEDIYSHDVTKKTFSNQLPQNVIQSYSLDGQFFTNEVNNINSYLDGTIGPAETLRSIFLIVNALLCILTVGLWIVGCAVGMYFMWKKDQKLTIAQNEALAGLVQRLNSKLTGNGFQWKTINIYHGVVLRLSYTTTLQTPPQTNQPINQDSNSVTVHVDV